MKGEQPSRTSQFLAALVVRHLATGTAVLSGAIRRLRRNLNDLEKRAARAVVGHGDACMDTNGADTADLMRDDTMT